MAAERQEPARLVWRNPSWIWAAAAFALGGVLNPLALCAATAPLVYHSPAAGSTAMLNYLVVAGPACAAVAISMLCWLGPQARVGRLIQVLSLTVVAGAVLLAIGAAATLRCEGAAAAVLDTRINLGLAVLVLSLMAGGAIAASAGFIFRFVALRRKRRRNDSSRDRKVRPREVGGEAAVETA